MKNKFYLLAFTLIFCSSLFAQVPGWAWAHSGTGSSSTLSYPTLNTSDAAGNVYAVGSFSSATIQFGSVTLNRISTTSLTNIFVVKYDSSGTVLWAKAAGGDHSSEAKAIAIDPSGNLYLAGWFFGDSLSFGSTAIRARHLNVTLQTSDWFIAKYDPSGSLSWAKTQDTTSLGLLYLNGIAADAGGNILVCGGANVQGGSVTYNGANILSTPLGTNDILLAKFDGAGTALWTKNAGNTGAYDLANGIAIDASGSCYITGYFQSSAAHFGSTLLVGNANSPHIFLAKYNAAGTCLWAKGSNTAGLGTGYKTAIDLNHNVIMAATFIGDSITFGTHTIHRNDTSASNNLVLVKYDSAGTATWVENAGNLGQNSNGPSSLVCGPAGSILMAGSFSGPKLVIGTDTFTNSGLKDIFLTSFSTSGIPLWTESSAISQNEWGYATYDAFGNVILSGAYDGNKLAIGIDTFTNADAPSYQPFVARSGVSQHTAISDVLADEMINIYPNPNSGRFGLSLPESAQSISIINILGQEIYNSNLRGQTQMTLSIETQGIYFITVKTPAQNISRRVNVQK